VSPPSSPPSSPSRSTSSPSQSQTPRTNNNNAAKVQTSSPREDDAGSEITSSTNVRFFSVVFFSVTVICILPEEFQLLAERQA
jgi:hypothetical protein